MATLPQPPAFNQMRQPDADHSELCGETALASALTAVGIPTSPEDVTTWLRNKYGERGVGGGTDGGELVAYLNAHNVQANIISAQPISTYLPACIARGHYTLCRIYSDAGGNPDPNHHTGHWLLGYGDDNFMNPYGGRYVTYPNLSGEDQDYALEILISGGPRKVANHINGPYAAIVSYPNGDGYWVVAADGGVETHDGGGAHFHGSIPALNPPVHLNAPIVDAASMATAEGYVMLASDGGVFAFGADGFYGSMGGQKMNAPAKSISVRADGTGYIILGEDGGVFTFGHEEFHGSELS